MKWLIAVGLACTVLQAVARPPVGLSVQETAMRCGEERCRKSREYSEILGRASWTFLHTMSVNYPDEPTAQQKADMLQLISLFGHFYPCKVCSEHFSEELVALPPRVGSRWELSQWLCELHNSVNERLGKPAFACSQVYDQWMRDPHDGYCPDVCPITFSAEEDVADAEEPPLSRASLA